MANQPRLLNWIELSRAAVKHNIASLAKLAGDRCLAVSVKANAYSHGLRQFVTMLHDHQQVDYVTVHSLEEAATCREAGWDRRIMMVGPLPPDSLDAVFELDLEPIILDRQSLAYLGRRGDKLGKKVRTHLKLETGTGRQGFTSDELPKLAEVYKRHKSLQRPTGASTHFANIEDTTNHEYAEHQLTTFNRMVRELNQLGIKPQMRHTACSAALILFDKTRFDLVRPGIAAYGHWPSKETYLSYRLSGGGNDLFHPVLTWKCRITQLKRLPADSFIGYGCTYRTTAPTRLAVLPIGYYEGYGRGLSNLGYVLIKGQRAPVRGRVCMNLTMVDVTDIKGVKLHDEAVLIGREGDERLTAEQLAAWTGSINYEILARLSPNTVRLIAP